jgi:hypothetical protein
MATLRLEKAGLEVGAALAARESAPHGAAGNATLALAAQNDLLRQELAAAEAKVWPYDSP